MINYIIKKTDLTKVCIIGLGISSALKGNIRGGAEKQMSLIAKGLKSRGVDVLVMEYFLKEEINIAGINFIPTWSSSSKSFRQKMNRLVKELEKEDVDVIYSRTTQLYVAILFFYLKIKRSKIKLYWGVGADEDLTSKLNFTRVKPGSSIYNKIHSSIIFNICSRLTFYFCDSVICQTNEQMKRCSKILSNKSTRLISNIFVKNMNQNLKPSKIIYDAIWVGKFSGNKGEQILLRLAKDLPNLKILCLGHVTKDFIDTLTFKEIENQNNLFLKGRVLAQDVPFYIAQVDFVLNTSPAEGLSNVFLEGWDLAKPVISFVVNPNEYLTKGEAGYCSNHSYNDLRNNISAIMGDKKFMNYHGERGRKILIENHNQEFILTKYIKLFTEK